MMNHLIDPSPMTPHRNIGLQFSGGKDSLAVAYLLRPHWDRLTFYHVDTGDLLPEMREIVRHIENQVPYFVRIATDARKWTDEVALPSDLVPMTCTEAGLLFGLSKRRLIDRFTCCHINLMMPLHERMKADGVTLAIRGTKRADFPKLPAENGPTPLGYSLWLPLLDWSHDDVFAYLREAGAPICRIYEHRVNSPECATCPAWWNEGRAAYLKKHHPDLAAAYSARLQAVAGEVMPVLATLQAEMAHG
jgi:phosphoadenosine phosphosulfate reductase